MIDRTGDYFMDEKEKKAPEEKKEKKNSLNVSRRGFLKGMGASAIATTLTSLPALGVPKSEAALPA